VSKEAIIQKTIHALTVLPNDKAQEISDFVDFILRKYEDLSLQQGMLKLQSESDAFNFLNDDEDLYSHADIKEK
jgi:hypothetical protein